MTAELLPCIELETGARPDAAVIWLHGLGADGNDFVPIVEEMRLPASLSIRFVFPHAPVRPVTLNNGFRMRAWYDIAAGDLTNRADIAGVRTSQAQLEALIARETARGVAARRIVARRILAGRRDRAAHRRAPCRAACRHRRAVDLRRHAGSAAPPRAVRRTATCRSSWRTGRRTR